MSKKEIWSFFSHFPNLERVIFLFDKILILEINLHKVLYLLQYRILFYGELYRSYVNAYFLSFFFFRGTRYLGKKKKKLKILKFCWKILLKIFFEKFCWKILLKIFFEKSTKIWLKIFVEKFYWKNFVEKILLKNFV